MRFILTFRHAYVAVSHWPFKNTWKPANCDKGESNAEESRSNRLTKQITNVEIAAYHAAYGCRTVWYGSFERSKPWALSPA